jgi:hypothetical protein
MMRVFLAFIVLTALLTGAMVYMYYIRRNIQYEGFSESDISKAEKTISEAVPGVDQATIARVLTIIKRMAATVLKPSFFADAVRKSSMSPMELARDYINSQKAKS